MKIERSWRDRHYNKELPKHYGVAYSDYYRAYDICYPIPLNYIIKYGRQIYFKVLEVFYWVGLIDIACNEEFHWDNFFRIKSH